MNDIGMILENKVLIVSVLAWFIAQCIKVVLVLIKSKEIDFTRIVGSGGMPSSHSAFVTSMTTSVGKINGFDSSLFAVCTIMSLVVMYDAAGVRRAAGKQAEVLNKLISEFESDTIKLDKRLKELLGHTPIEVIAGAILGIYIGIKM